MLRKVIILFCIVLIHISANANNGQDTLFVRTKLNFYILESEISEGNYLSGDWYELGFKQYDNKRIPNNRPSNDRMITLRSEFVIDSAFLMSELYLVVLPIDYPCRIYFNGELLLLRGDYKYGYTNRMHSTEKALLPIDKIQYGEKNEIAFQLFPKEGETYPVSNVFISNSQDASRYMFFRNLLGTKLIIALSLCCFVFFVFYLIIYISRREYQRQHFLFFALMNLFFVVSYINNIFSYDYTYTYIFEKIARVGFPLFIFVGICFLLEYTNVFEKKRMIKIGILLAYIPSIVMVMVPKTTTGIINAYNSYPLISLFVGNIILFVLTLLYFNRERDLKSFFLFFIFSMNIISGFHDGYYFAILETKPFILLTPNTVFGINLIIFFILAVDHSNLYHVALKSSEELEKLNQHLELLVEKRTKKTKEYAVKLEEANNTKDKFFSIIAHDLKNPFNTLIGYSDLLKSEFREYGQNEIQQHLSTIYDTSVKGYNLLENLLKWSQTQTNKIEFEPVKINLHEIVQTCIDDIEHQSQFKDIEVHNDVPKTYNIIADENLLKTILRNLINNAVKYTPRNGYIAISSVKDDVSFEISVKDSGIGMTEIELKNLFKIDQISSKPGTDKEKGSGLGLVLCKEFVEKHGGKIWVESDLETGSVFKFTIPKIIQMN